MSGTAAVETVWLGVTCASGAPCPDSIDTAGGMRLRSGNWIPFGPWCRQLQVLPATEVCVRHWQRSWFDSVFVDASPSGEGWQDGRLAVLAADSFACVLAQ